jgi:hypothetical protein
VDWILSHLIAFFLGGFAVLIYFIIADLKIGDIEPEDVEYLINQSKLFEEE